MNNGTNIRGDGSEMSQVNENLELDSDAGRFPKPNSRHQMGQPGKVCCVVAEAFGGICDETPSTDFLHLEDLDGSQSEAINSKLNFTLRSNARLCKKHMEQLSIVQKNKLVPGRCEGFCGVKHKKGVTCDPMSAYTFYTQFEGNQEGVFPGTRVCKNCFQKLKNKMAEPNIQLPKNDDDDYNPEMYAKFQKVLLAAKMEPFKFKRLSMPCRARLAAKCIRDLVDICLEALTSDGLVLKKSELFPQLKQDAELKTSFESVMDDLKSKFEASDYREKIQVLTLAPSNWSVQKTVEFFGSGGAECTTYGVGKAITLKASKGPLAMPPRRTGKRLPDVTKKLVKEFYLEDSNSRVFPGMNDTVSVRENGVKVRKVKRLLLGNLRDIHKLYIHEHGATNPIGFIRFCTNRPAEIILAGARGVHNVCVCQYHGNVTLMLEAIKENKLFRSRLFDALVCENISDDENVRKQECMLGTCENCKRPNTQKKLKFAELVRQSLQNKHKKEIVTYSQWTTEGSRAHLETTVASTEEFIETLYGKFQILLPHHFVSGTQAIEFKRMRTADFLGDDKMVIQVDFGENYSFLVQDAPQSFHWETSQATIHPFGAWVKVGEKVEYISSAVISNERRHDTESFFAFLKTFLDWILKEHKHVKHIEYWSDGCAGQYKNCKNFDNLLNHLKDFNVSANWNFFATSHGKGAVDGISSLLKQSARRHSMRSINGNYILEPIHLYEHCAAALPNIKLLYVTSENIDEISAQYKLDKRFEQASTYPETRMCHKLVPNNGTLEMYRTSIDIEPFNKRKHMEITYQVEIGEWLAVKDVSTWYLACVLDVNEEAGIARVHYVDKPGESPSYKFSGRLEHHSGWVPFSDVVAKVKPVSGKTTRTRSHFFLTVEDRSKIETNYVAVTTNK